MNSLVKHDFRRASVLAHSGQIAGCSGVVKLGEKLENRAWANSTPPALPKSPSKVRFYPPVRPLKQSSATYSTVTNATVGLRRSRCYNGPQQVWSLTRKAYGVAPFRPLKTLHIGLDDASSDRVETASVDAHGYVGFLCSLRSDRQSCCI